MIIDELVAVLGFDLKNTDDLQKFNRGLDTAAKRAENFSRSMGKMALKAAGVATAMAAAGAAAAKGLVSFVTPVTQKMDELVKASDRLGIGFENLQALGFAAEQSGSSIEGLQASLQSVTRNLSEAARGTGRAKIVLKDYGLSATDAAGKIKDADTFLLELADRFEGMSEQQQVDLAGKLGIDNGLITLLKSGRRGIKELTDQARNLGFVIDEKAARGAEKFNDQMNVLSNIWFGIRNRAALGMVPWMQRFAEDLEAWYRDNAETISDLVESVVEGVGRFATRMREHFNTLSQLYSENADRFWDWAKPVLILIGIILARRFPFVAAMGAIVFAVDEFLTYLQKGQSVLGDFINALARLTGAQPEQVAQALATLGESVAWMGAAAIGVGLFAGAVSRLATALGKLKPVYDVMAKLAGFKQWGAVAAGAAAVAATTGTASAAGVTGAGAAGVAGNAASKAPWLPGMRSPLGRLLGPVGTIGTTGFDIKSRMDRLAVLTEQNGGDQVKAMEELQRENSLSVYEAADRMTKVLEAIKENTQGLVNWMGFGGGGKSFLADTIRASGYQGSGSGGKSSIADTIRKSASGRASPLLDLIGYTEGTDKGRGYNETLGYGSYTGGDVNLTGMTLDEVDALQTKMLRHPNNRFNSSAVGRYQFVRTTLRNLRRQKGLKGNERFSPEMQDMLAAELLKQRGLDSYLAGNMSEERFMNNLSKEWASLPTSAGGGHYAGQRAAVGPTRVRATLADLKSGNGRAAKLLANYQGNASRLDGATAATNATMLKDSRSVTQNITVGDVHAAPGERVDRATARAVGTAAAGAGRVSEPARIAAQQAALP